MKNQDSFRQEVPASGKAVFLLTSYLLIIWNVISWKYPFFWDTISVSRHATFFLENNFQRLIPPEAMDPGHPTLPGLFMAVVWRFFGRTLMVSHLAMLPFLIGIAWQWLKLCNRFLTEKMLFPAVLLLVFEPTFISQAGLVNPDIALLFFTLLAINSILSKNSAWLVVGLLGISLISLRGVLSLPAFFLIDLFLRWKKKQPILRAGWLMPYVVAGVTVIGWLYYHYSVAGWAYSPPAETYGSHRGFSGLTGVLKNSFIILWRFLDQGRIALWTGIVFMAFSQKNTVKKIIQKHSELFVVFLAFTVSLSLFFVILSGPIGHRYFLFSFLLTGLIFLVLLETENYKHTGSILTIVCLMLISGHLWIYPDRISKGWDATLSYTNYFEAEDELLEYISKNELDPSTICADFPALNSRYISHLSGDSTQSFTSKNLTDSNACQYLYYSNVMNGFSDNELGELNRNWNLLHEFRNGLVKVILYERK